MCELSENALLIACDAVLESRERSTREALYLCPYNSAQRAAASSSR